MLVSSAYVINLTSLGMKNNAINVRNAKERSQNASLKNPVLMGACLNRNYDERIVLDVEDMMQSEKLFLHELQRGFSLVITI